MSGWGTRWEPGDGAPGSGQVPDPARDTGPVPPVEPVDATGNTGTGDPLVQGVVLPALLDRYWVPGERLVVAV
ncbi:hypothetical protein, partial [Kineococcus glutinatus]|uniref:hypothetical protein n=1 Tax=Kineococcus glutinatus TaxID=1070872 RepID=UPI003CD0B3C0